MKRQIQNITAHLIIIIIYPYSSTIAVGIQVLGIFTTSRTKNSLNSSKSRNYSSTSDPNTEHTPPQHNTLNPTD